MTATIVSGSTSGSVNSSTYSKVLPLSIRKDVINGGYTSSPVSGGSEDSPTSMPSSCSTEQREMVRITLTYPASNYGNLSPHKEIVIRLTNDDNPAFFYHLRILESDFPALKQQQGLLVDFVGFPAQLVSLLDKCDPNNLDSEETTSLRNFVSCTPKFILVLKVLQNGNTVLDIVESNPFKYLCHLSLHITAGSDAEVKKYLCDMTTTIKKDFKVLQEKYTHLSTTLEADLRRVNLLYETKCTELNRIKEDHHQQTTQLTAKHFQELNAEKEKMFKLQNEVASRCDAEKSEMERQHSQMNQQLQLKIASLETELHNMTQQKNNQESALQDASSRLRVSADDLTRSQQEISNLRQQNTKLDYDYHQIRIQKMEFQREIQNLQKDAQKNQEILQKQNDDIISMTCEKRHLEDQKNALAKELEDLKTSYKTTTAELTKANEIIMKFQDDIRSCHAKNKTQALTISEQDAKLGDQQEEIDNLKKDVSELKSNIFKTTATLEDRTRELDEVKEKVRAQERTLDSNENMISWLNKQLNELQGLSDLHRFRQQLGNLSVKDSTQKNKENDPSNAPLRASNNADERLPRPPLNRNISDGADLGTSHLNSSTKHGISSMNSPSWLHIYQSTGNSSHHDLSSRMEQVSALGAILSQSQSSRQNADKSNGNVEQNDSSTASARKSTGKTASNSCKQPTWARPKPKVTLDAMINKPTFPIWKNK